MRRSILWIALVLALSPSLVHAQLGPGSRAEAIGAYTALANDIYGCYYNPAAAAGFTGVRGSIGDFESQVSGPYNIFDLIGNLPTDTQSQINFARQFSSAPAQGEVSSDVGAGFKNFALSVLPLRAARSSPTGMPPGRRPASTTLRSADNRFP